ncbi:DUF1016 domain-containing protein [Xylanibacter oryzae]|uniref:DUF1016 domain-containing protein n=1 Tax=Xylanibacter oryzae TaxID=185293 RepID=UPI001FDFE545|nr:DUF1016 domain-containing protein [Xylanibacter oryzae]
MNNFIRFLIELGQGFAYVGRQVPLVEVGDETLFADPQMIYSLYHTPALELTVPLSF